MNYRPKEEFACYQLPINFRNFAQKGVSTFHNVWAVEKKMKSCFDIRTTATDWINSIKKLCLNL